jgi:hypothetical protein
MSEWINYAKEKIEQGKEDAFVWFSVASRWFLLANILLYVASCIVAGGMVGPVRYIEFVYHCCHFEQAAQAAVTVSAAPNPCTTQTDRHDRHQAPVVVMPESKF